jgi:REP element-mobilizing transposase RayT
MGWKLRSRGENLYHHIYAWGNDRHPVFKATRHYQKYLMLLEKYASAFDIDIVAYALMETHIHVFVYDRSNNLSNFMMKLHGHYARYYNKVNERVGHVFGERFNNKIVAANIYGKWLSRYIHRQAVEASLVENPADFPWSSYRVYAGLESKGFIKPEVILMQFGNGEDQRRDYRAFVLSLDDGPVDWGKKYFALVKGDDLIHYICRTLNLEISLLTNPRGAKERRVRQMAIRILHEKYGYKASLLARIFGLSRAGMKRILTK